MKIKKFLAKKTNRIVIFVATIFILLGIGLYNVVAIWTYSTIRTIVVEHNLLTTRSNIESIKRVFTISHNSVLELANNITLTKDDPVEIQKILNKNLQDWDFLPIAEIVYVNIDGLVINVAPKNDQVIGLSVIDRDYFTWAKTASQGSVNILPPVLSRQGKYKGQYFIPIATPIYKSNEFVGVVGYAIPIFKLSSEYLMSQKELKITQVYIMNNENEVFSGPDINFFGRKIDVYLDKFGVDNTQQITLFLKKAFTTDREEILYTTWPVGDSGNSEKSTLVARKLNFGSLSFVVLLISSDNQNVEPTMQLFMKIYMGLLFVQIAMVISSCLLLILGVKMVKKRAYIDGFMSGRDYQNISIRKK